MPNPTNPTIPCQTVDTPCCAETPRIIKLTSSSNFSSTDGLIAKLVFKESWNKWVQSGDVDSDCGTMPDDGANIELDCSGSSFSLDPGYFEDAATAPSGATPTSEDCDNFEYAFSSVSYIFGSGPCSGQTHDIVWTATPWT